jgi:nucleoside diphosphate kinase
LSAHPAKRALYATDLYFIEAWRHLIGQWGDARAVRARLHRLTLAVLRPDAIASRAGERLLRALGGAGLTTVACAAVRFDRHTVRAMWCYEMCRTDPARLEFLEAVMCASTSLVLMLRSGDPADVSAVDRLRHLKGPADPLAREPHHLRAVAGDVQTGAITYLHAADESADVVRELGILFDGGDQRRILASLDDHGDCTADATRLLDALHDSTPRCDLRFGVAVARLCEVLDSDSANRLRRLTGNLARTDWTWLLGLADFVPEPATKWDVLTVAAWLCPPRRSTWTAYGPGARSDVSTDTKF